MYGRYLDDIFTIVEASSMEDALSKVQGIQFPGLKVDWSVSQGEVTFLDLRVGIDSETKLYWRPYAKGLNHNERVPWESFHPQWVKRGCYLGELSRLASLSRHMGAYIEAVRRFEEILRARGWPSGVIRSWHGKYVAQRWEDSSKKPVERLNVDNLPVFLPTTYNPIWDNVSAHDIYQAMLPKLEEFWEQNPDSSKIASNGLMFSYTKGTSLEDFLNVWNREVLENLGDMDFSPSADGMTPSDAFSVLLYAELRPL